MIPVRNCAMELCNDFIGTLFFIKRTMWCSFKGPCVIKSFKILTPYNIWFARYRPSDVLIPADFALVLVFINHDDVIKWKYFPRNWPFVREIHRSPVNFPHKGQWRGALMFSLIYTWINDWVNNREAGDLRRQHGHYDVIVMLFVSGVCREIWFQDRFSRGDFFIQQPLMPWCNVNMLTYQRKEKMLAFLRMIFSNSFLRMRIIALWCELPCNMFPRVQLKIKQFWFREWPITD